MNDDLPHDDSEYVLKTTFAPPPELRGQRLTLAFSFLHAKARLFAGGEEMTALDPAMRDGFRGVDQPLWRILPEFCAKYPVYERMGLRELSQALHAAYAKGDIARLTTEMYLSELHPAMKPSDAYARIAHRETERVPIDELEGRITTSLLTPYPPGIPLLIPGEVFNRKIVQYLKFTREFNAAFPGFDTDVHGLVEQDGEYFVDCVRD